MFLYPQGHPYIEEGFLPSVFPRTRFGNTTIYMIYAPEGLLLLTISLSLNSFFAILANCQWKVLYSCIY